MAGKDDVMIYKWQCISIIYVCNFKTFQIKMIMALLLHFIIFVTCIKKLEIEVQQAGTRKFNILQIYLSTIEFNFK